MANKQNTDKQPEQFDGMKIARNLEKGGMDRCLAETIADGLQQAVHFVLARTVSKEEFATFMASMEHRFAAFQASMERRFSDFKDETRADNAAFRDEIRADNAAFRDETRQELAGLRQDNAKQWQAIADLRVEMHQLHRRTIGIMLTAMMVMTGFLTAVFLAVAGLLPFAGG